MKQKDSRELLSQDTDYEQVYAGMAKCSNYAHDKALQGGIAFPEPDELLADIMTINNWRQKVEVRSRDTAKRRKS